MYQPWIFAATLAAGSGMFAYAAVQHRLVPPSIAPAPESVQIVRPLTQPEPIVEPASTALELEPIVIEGRRRVTRAPARPEPVVEVVEVARPCSTWREISPSHVSQGKPTGTVSVRELCP
jgi:hypothetical protein